MISSQSHKSTRKMAEKAETNGTKIGFFATRAMTSLHFFRPTKNLTATLCFYVRFEEDGRA
jgi:hypothetical protein